MAPGVYIEELQNLPPSIASVETAVPAFIGYTQHALDAKGASVLKKPTRIASMVEYEAIFGMAPEETALEVTFVEAPAGGPANIFARLKEGGSPHNMFHAMQAYFANGGGACYVVSAGGYKQRGEALAANDFLSGLAAVELEDEPTLLVFPEGQRLSEAEHLALLTEALEQCGRRRDRFTLLDMHQTGMDIAHSGGLEAAIGAFRSGLAPKDPISVRYGAAYFPNLLTNFEHQYKEEDVKVVHKMGKAYGALNGRSLAEVRALDGAMYSKLKQAVDALPVMLPPSAFMAGVYASVDSMRGVWKAPANVPLVRATGVAFQVNDSFQEQLTADPLAGKSINSIRVFPGRGTVVWGARTLAGNDNEWRYLNVGRVVMMVEKSCVRAVQAFVFEPNDAGTWVKVQGMVENFLITLWRNGALMGAKPEQAFFVSVGLGKTMTAEDVEEGRLIVEIGMATVRPAEFVILRFMVKMAG